MKTIGITEGAVFCALAVVLTLIRYYLPILGLLVLIIPVTMIILGKRQGLKVSIISSLAAVVLLSLFIGPINAVLLGAPMFVVGCSLGYAYNKDSSPVVKVVIGALAFSVLVVAEIMSYQLLLGISFTDYLFQTLEASNKEVLMIYETMNVMSSETLEAAKASMEDYVWFLKLILPLALILTPVILSFLNVKVADLILKRIGYPVKTFKALGQWELPESLKVFLMIFLFSDFVISIFQITAIPQIYRFTLTGVVNIIFFVMGLALILNYMEFKQVTNKGLKVLVVMFSFLIASVITIVGVADTYIGIRRIYRRESQIK